MSNEVNYDLILLKYSDRYENIHEALKIAEKFIKQKKLLLVGGQAIDYALRLKKSALYSEDETPDYDCYSSNSYEDAQELGMLLCKANLPNVSIIYGLHLTTMRVRVDFTPVADISYCPEIIYETLDYLDYKGFRIIHPHIQMIDQHRALSYPYEHLNSGGTVFRWQKDIDRNNLLFNFYPIESKNTKKIYRKQSIAIDMLRGQCIAGYSAYDVYMKLVKVNNKEWEFPHGFCIYSSTFEDTIKKFESKKKGVKKMVNRYMDRFPRSAELGEITIYDNNNAMIAANTLTDKCEMSNNNNTEITDDYFINFSDIYVVSPHHVMMFLLHNKEYTMYNEMRDLDLPITVFPYGTELLMDAQDSYYNTFDTGDVSRVPKRLYPKVASGCHVESTFDYSSKYFQIDGAPI